MEHVGFGNTSRTFSIDCYCPPSIATEAVLDNARPKSHDSCRYLYSVGKFQSFRDTQSAVIVGILGDYDPTQSLGRHRDGHFPGENMPATILEIVLNLTYAADFVSLRRVHADTRLVLSYIGGHHQYTEL